MTSAIRSGTVALLLTLMPFVSMAQDDPVTVSHFYQVHYLRPGNAQVLAKQACGGEFTNYCKMSIGAEGFIEFTGTAEQQETLARELENTDVPPPTQIFQIHVLDAKVEPQAMPQLPEPAVRALTDLMQLLPYRGFELVDSGFMRTSGEAELYLGSGRRYQARLEFQGDPTAGKPLQIRFRLSAEKRTRAADGSPVADEAVDLLGTTFSMSVGETVVVGTSKLNGYSDALVVLLSAAP